MQVNAVRRLLPLALCLAVLHGCGQLPERATRPAADPDVARAAELQAQGRYLDAAELYRALANRTADADRRSGYLLAAGEAAAQGGDWDAVRESVIALQTRPLAEIPALRYRLLLAELLLKERRSLDAIDALAEPPSPALPPNLQERYFRDLARAYRQAGNLLESANALQQVDRLMSNRDARLDNQIEILRTLALLNERVLESLQPTPPGIQGGWMQLALLVKQHGTTPEQLAPLLDRWHAQFPGHPALPELLTDYADRLRGQWQQVSHIAVLLPQSGQFSEVAAAIRDGMMVTRLQWSPEQRPELRFYDSTDPTMTWPLYNQAVAEGAELVIGPLQKEGVDQLVRAGELAVPVLALNEVALTSAPPDNLFMYALSPEDEARQVAERIWLDGARRPALLVPEGGWGERIASAFETRWQGLGGELAGIARYDSESFDYSNAIKALMHIDESEARRRELEQWIGRRVEFEPRRRDDVDAVFIAARPAQAQGIRPQLQFHQAADLPVYATSHAWLGQLTSNQAEDMRGILLPDIPWLIPGADETGSRSEVVQYLPQSGSAYGRLYAMGMDALKLVPHLNRLSSSRFESLDGSTGNLYMDESHRIRRQMVWLRLDETPEVLGFAPRLDLQQAPVELAPVEAPQTQTAPAS